MPLKRRIIQFGRSRVITIPKDWLELAQEKVGKKIEFLLVEVDDELRIRVPEK